MNRIPTNNMKSSSQRQSRWTAVFASLVLIFAASGFLLDAHHEQVTIKKGVSIIDLHQVEDLEDGYTKEVGRNSKI
ncbi:hypothetical protein [Marinomonas balearica]|uniref:Uncharacterized protein n=1 Tax=Marinomonas balearica TaxID=491947 RepID=A0A4R6MDJ9_9GAMM|nr:hypothetical protein [Marinomonas balearica]TDO99476.1 hypothetical protein DFP79_0459 [Marinomonas balearica]